MQPAYYSHFILSCSHQQVLSLLAAADYLHIDPLIELCCARLGRLLINKTPAEVTALLLSTPNDTGADTRVTAASINLTAEEIQQLLASFLWTTGVGVPAEAGAAGDPTDTEAEPEEILTTARALREEYLLNLQHQTGPSP